MLKSIFDVFFPLVWNKLQKKTTEKDKYCLKSQILSTARNNIIMLKE